MNKHWRGVFSYVVGIVLIMLSVWALAQTPEMPDKLVQRVSQGVLDAAKSDQAIQEGNQKKILDLVEQKVVPYVDFQRMTALAAGRNWRQATPEQQEALIKAFRTLLIYTYSGALSQVKDQTILFKPFTMAPDETDVEVKSQVKPAKAGQVIELNYRLSKTPSGWKIYDINVLGVWLIETYKGNFTGEINKAPDVKTGIDQLIQVLVAKNTKLASSFLKKNG